MGTSTNPEFLTFPVKANTLVPFDVWLPIAENHFPPLVNITGILASV